MRHFGLPPTSLLGRTAADGGRPASETAPQLSKAADVGLEGGALLFPRTAQELTQKAKVERATVLLETLRADGAGSFGGKVRGGVDVGASLRSYFRSLDIAHIAAERGADKAVAAFLDGLDVPDDVRPLLASSGITLAWVEEGAPTPVSYWGESEADVIGHEVNVRADTPVLDAAGTTVGPTTCQPPSASSTLCPPRNGASVLAFRPACASWIPVALPSRCMDATTCPSISTWSSR